MSLKISSVNLREKRIPREVLNSVPENLIRRYKIFPYDLKENKLYLAMYDPTNFLAIDDVSLYTGKKVEPKLTTKEDIELAIERYLDFSNKVVNILDKVDTTDDAPLKEALKGIIEQAIKMEASDIHIEPKENESVIRFRIDGVLKNIIKVSQKVREKMVSIIKVESGMDIAENRLPQDGRFKVKQETKVIDLRISSLPTITGEKIVIRILDNKEELMQIKELGYDNEELKKLYDLLRFSNGMILVTGPIGSGKTTTLYACLNHILNQGKNIITIEDPVEYTIKEINQVQVNSKAGLYFSNGLKAILRQDPDVIMVGEIRDEETAKIATRAASTGHLVFSTLHTNNAASSLTRLIDMGVEPYLVASSIIGIVSQRLVRKVCPYCLEKYEPLPESEEMRFLGDEYKKKKIRLSRGVGCSYCNFTGYKGRVAIQEILKVTGEERSLMQNKQNEKIIENSAIKNSMVTMKEDGIKKALKGITTIDEVMRVTYGG